MKKYFMLLLFSFAVIFFIKIGFSQKESSPLKTEVIQDITMVTIPSGNFQMGHDYKLDPAQSEKVNKYFADEQPVHLVTLSSFQIGRTEITQGQFKIIMGKNPATFSGDDNLPVTNVSANEALEFCNKLSKVAGLKPCCDEKTGKCDLTKNGFRLPTEAEWEYVCRAGTSTLFYTGDKESDLDRAGWYIGNSGGKIHPVAQKEPNAWGLFDMHGNVFEFCYDGYSEVYNYKTYPEKSVTNPINSEEFNLRIIRGGGWFSEPFSCRSFSRGCFWTGGGNYYIGFRVARSVR